jgi:uridylate kinase
MKKRKEKSRLWVISLGGSRIVPDEVDVKFLERFKKMIDSHPTHKFVAVTGGGSTARNYITALRTLGKKNKAQSMSGIAITRFHAGFMARYFGKSANEEIPRNMKKVKDLLRGNQIVFCGGLRYGDKNTSDGTAAQLASYLKCPFINLTNVKGLYTSNPKKNKKAKFIPKITWKKFDVIASKIKYKAGQHFVLDQSAAKRIKKHKIPTYIVGNVKAIGNIIAGKRFTGTLIEG